MFRILGKSLAILFVTCAHLVMYGALLGIIGEPHSDFEFVLYISMPFADVGVLGFWLVVGSHRAWLRLMVAIVGFCTILACGVNAMDLHPMVLGPAYATTLSSVALGTLGLGCVAAYFPGWRGWQVRFALWEIIAATCLIAVALAILRAITVNDLLNWQAWVGKEGREFLTFSVTSGFFLAVAGLPILAVGGKVRVLSILATVPLMASVPSLEIWLFQLFGMGTPEYGMLFKAHVLQLAFAWGTLVPLRWAFPGLVQAWHRADESVVNEETSKSPNISANEKTSEDFFEMK
ncbi:hypothetical protein [Blastopirellula marina]|uniref:Uncharacterized protein n=1 Tax=Blastopirellula marina TaxID=124 RepID=A0A2S8FWW4_9BACT|nr:hypothetical protein [Blastopirellula marina]PQO36667.1 hypothetical protein C5Y98_11790 [Blastopirellula marina]PTL44497.1 hypothetical protein C5Y97_11800 [Blastopirellula marina]